MEEGDQNKGGSSVLNELDLHNGCGNPKRGPLHLDIN